MFMDKFFLCACGALLLISLLLLTRLFKVKKFSEKFIVILVAGTNIVLLLLLLGSANLCMKSEKSKQERQTLHGSAKKPQKLPIAGASAIFRVFQS